MDFSEMNSDWAAHFWGAFVDRAGPETAAAFEFKEMYLVMCGNKLSVVHEP